MKTCADAIRIADLDMIPCRSAVSLPPARLEVPVEEDDADLIAAVLGGNPQAFEPLLSKYQPRVFATARRYARRESEVEDIVQEVFLRAFQKLNRFRGDAPFAHWLMRLTVRICFDFLRGHQRNRETSFTELSEPEKDWLDTYMTDDREDGEMTEAAQQLVSRVLEMLSPSARLLITLLEIEERSMKEVAALTGWSVPVIKVRAFRARAQMKKQVANLAREKYL